MHYRFPGLHGGFRFAQSAPLKPTDTFRFSEHEVRRAKISRFLEFTEIHGSVRFDQFGRLNLLFPRYMDHYRRPYLSGLFRAFSSQLVDQVPLIGYALNLEQPALWNICLSLVENLSALEKPNRHEFFLWLKPGALDAAIDNLTNQTRGSAGDYVESACRQQELAMRAYFHRLYEVRVISTLTEF